MTRDDAARRHALVNEMRRLVEERAERVAAGRRGKECPIQRPMFDKW